jgi:hypothetical protein
MNGHLAPFEKGLMTSEIQPIKAGATIFKFPRPSLALKINA